jgi:hypothetical protein
MSSIAEEPRHDIICSFPCYMSCQWHNICGRRTMSDECWRAWCYSRALLGSNRCRRWPRSHEVRCGPKRAWSHIMFHAGVRVPLPLKKLFWQLQACGVSAECAWTWGLCMIQDGQIVNMKDGLCMTLVDGDTRVVVFCVASGMLVCSAFFRFFSAPPVASCRCRSVAHQLNLAMGVPYSPRRRPVKLRCHA